MPPKKNFDQLTTDEIENRLKKPDCILEKDVLDLLVTFYLKTGANKSKVDSILQELSQNYVGTSQLLQLAIQWLALTATPEEPTPDLYQLLRNEVITKFNPSTVDTSSGPPMWLTSLTETKRGREVVMMLSSQHPKSQLLTYAVRRFVQDESSRKLMPLEPSELDTVFPIFNQKITWALCDVINAPESDVEQAANVLLKLTLHQDHTFVYVYCMLCELCTQNVSYRLTRLKDDLLREASLQVGPSIYALEGLLQPCADVPATSSRVQKLVASCLQVSSPSYDLITQLYDLYAVDDVAKRPPMVYIQQPGVLDMLIKVLFESRARAGDGTVLSHVAFLLGCATVCVDKGAGQDDVAGDGGNKSDVEQSESKVQSVQDMLVTAAHMYHCILTGRQISAQESVTLEQILQVPVVAYGLSKHVCQIITTGKFFQSVTTLRSVPLVLRVLHLIVTFHDTLADDVSQSSFKALTGLTVTQNDISQGFIVICVEAMVSSSCIEASMQRFNTYFQSIDEELVRFTVKQILRMCQGPFSLSFTLFLLRAMVCGSFTKRRECPPNGVYRAYVDEFLAGCTGDEVVGQLSEEEQKYLQTIKNE